MLGTDEVRKSGRARRDLQGLVNSETARDDWIGQHFDHDLVVRVRDGIGTYVRGLPGSAYVVRKYYTCEVLLGLSL